MKYFGDVKDIKGKVHIIRDRCKGCGFCVEFCPRNVLELSPEFNRKGYHPPRVRDEGECMYCQMCQSVCPEFSIFVTPRPEEEE